MKKIITALFIIISAFSFADQLIISGNIKINLKDDSTYTYVYDGEVITTPSGRKIVIKNDKTWDYVTEKTNLTASDKTGKRIWIKSDGKWGYIRSGYDKNDFRFKEISLNKEGNSTRITGKVKNLSGENYQNAVYRVIVFDSDSYDYKPLGEFQIGNFMANDEVRFDGVINVKREKILDYYIETTQLDKMPVIQKIQIEKVPKKKTLGDAFEELH